MLEHFKDIGKVQEVLCQAQTGLWAIELDEGKQPRMYADTSMLELLGFDEVPSPEECYREWYGRIEDQYYPVVHDVVERMTADERAEVQYSWNHPKWGKIYVRCGGVKDVSYSPGICLRGYHQNITDTIMLKQEYDSIIRTLNNECMVILLCNLQDKSYKIIKRSEPYKDCFAGLTDYEADFRHCIECEAVEQYSSNTVNLLAPDLIKKRIAEGENELESIYRSKNGGWRRLRILLSGDYCEEYPWVILAVDGQEAERKAEVLSKLCNSYYSVYVFDLERDIEEAIWQEDQKREQEFPVGSLKTYYEKFIQEYVWTEDQEKMRRAGNPEFLRNTLSQDQPAYDVDYRRKYPEGLQWVRARFCIEEIRDGVVTKVVFANMNIHEQKIDELRQEEQNRKALLAAYETAKKANDAKSSFLAQMSHDIRTPMNAIIGMTSIAASHAEEPEKVRDCLEKISYSSSHLLKLINEVLDMSKIEKGKMELAQEPFYLDRMIREVSTIIRTEAIEKQLEVHIKIEKIIHNHLAGDELRIRQVLLNLANNAVKYTPAGGKIQIEVHEVSAGTPGTGCFVFTVEDNGIGMPDSFRDYIFVPFSRAESVRSRNIQGTGLGMSIAHGIVEAMQGNIQVESKEGRGSRFTVTLNLRIADEDKAGRENKESDMEYEGIRAAKHRGIGQAVPAGDFISHAEDMKGMRLLLVEDNALNQEIARTLLEESGFQIDCADDGLEAVEKFKLSKPGTYHAILMDLQMPVMDGCTAAKEIRRSSHPEGMSVPIIALTANAFAEDVAKALASGMDDHISKPIDYQRLLSALERVVLHKEDHEENFKEEL